MILLKEIREQKKLSQYQLASLSGVPQQTISAIESQKRQNPGVETLYPIAKALGCTVDDVREEDWPGRKVPNEHGYFDNRHMKIMQIQEDIGMLTIVLSTVSPKAVAGE